MHVAQYPPPHDLTWYPDTGATHHMTSTAPPDSVLYSGNTSVLLGNGASLPIINTGNIPVSLGSHTLSLNNVQHQSSQLAILELHPLHASPTAAATEPLSSVSVPPPSAPVSPQLAQPGIDSALPEPDLAPPPAVTGLDCPTLVLPEFSDVPSVSVLDQPAISPAPPVPIHPMTTRFRDGILQPKVRTDGTVRYPLSKAHASMVMVMMMILVDDDERS
ncbi:hypothetical protein LWI29_025420 [Acer saccharum]|uniref:Uncharacterized protein n=1 Tax=Acer saccharum TaxID=4024 RepID=A0AA39W006_ACESA|nr:hypothetical protein LWI29_025420 [Acer saccharum]